MTPRAVAAGSADHVARRSGGARRAVLVTGASKGIGEACAMLLAEHGFRVYAGVRRSEDGAALVRRAGAAVVPVLLDVTDAGQIAAAAAQVEQQLGSQGLHALINNAGVAIAGPLEFLPIDELRRQTEINFVGQIAVTQACLPLLRRARDAAPADRRAGRIVFMSSVSGRSAMPFVGAYAASKFALEAAADALRVELLPFGLRVVLIEPGVITTPIWDTAVQAGERNLQRAPPELERYYGRVAAALRARMARGIRGLPPERVAAVVLRALTARRPRIRYVVGNDARARIWLRRLLPTRAGDWVTAQVMQRL
jgi:NAD(P)-dependent dehydrogenase (short-subunit alcohol dehydrogenase family)